MRHPEKLEPLLIDSIEAQPNGPMSYFVRDISAGTALGVIRVGDDLRFEARHDDGRFAGIHKTLADAMQSLVYG